VSWASSAGGAAFFTFAIASCTAILGNDFVITEGSGASGGGSAGGASATTGGAGGAGAAGGSGGGDDAPGPLQCDWLTLERVQTLATDEQYGGGRMYISRAGQAVRWAATAFSPAGSNIHVFMATDNQVSQASFAGTDAFPFIKLDGNNYGMINGDRSGGVFVLRLLMLANGETNGIQEELARVVGNTNHAEAVGFSSGDDGTASIMYATRVDNGDYTASLVRWNGADVNAPVAFNDSSDTPSLNSNDYEIMAIARDGTTNYAILGGPFEGAARTRHFLVPDDVTGAVTPIVDTPASSTDPILAAVQRRSDGDFLVIDVQIGGTPKIYMGVLPFAEIPTHDALALPSVTSLPATSVPTGEVDLMSSPESLVIGGVFANNSSGVHFSVVHRQSGVRFDGLMPFPAGILPNAFTIGRLNGVILDDLFDTGLGGKVWIAFHITDTALNQQQMFFGRVACSPI
jgi:hypothetical protein